MPGVKIRRVGSLIVATALLGVTAPQVAAETAANLACLTSGSDVPSSRIVALRRGFNLTGWLDHAPGAQPRRPSQGLLMKLAQKGFTHVRLPVTAELILPALAAPNQVQTNLAELDRALTLLFAAGLAVSLDLHPSGSFASLHSGNPPLGLQLLSDLWRTLASRYAALEPDRLFFELLNEPQVESDLWRLQATELIHRIREVSPTRTIVYGPARFSRYDELTSGPPLEAPNIVYAVHFYDPMPFTHQGADWDPEDPNRYYHNIPFPSARNDGRIAALMEELAKNGQVSAAAMLAQTFSEPWNRERVEAAIAGVGDWMAKTKSPVIINEFGVLNRRVAPSDRASWLRAVRGAAERHCIGWAHWEYADAFGFVKLTNQGAAVDASIIAALMDPISP